MGGNNNPQSGTITNSYVIAELSGGHPFINSRIAGIVSDTNQGLIQGVYFSGTIHHKEDEYMSPIIFRSGEVIDVFHTIPDYNPQRHILIDYDYSAFYISVDELKSGQPIEGLDAFIFKTNEYPRLKE